MTKEDVYELMQKQNWYKLFLKEMETNVRNQVFNKNFKTMFLPKTWIDRAMWWDSTSQGQSYWSKISDDWENKF